MAFNLPVRKELEPGTYPWCSCGRSGDAPFCDVSHPGCGAEVAKKGKSSLCTCRKTKKPPFCDGTHERVRIRTAHHHGAQKGRQDA